MHLYLALCYLTTSLYAASGYVLLAANIEDFKTLAKQFVPDNMADEIFKLAQEAVHRDNRRPNEYPKFRDIDPILQKTTNSYTVEDRPTFEFKQDDEIETTSKATTSRYALSLDDLVEKVKQRLHSELALMAATAAKHEETIQTSTDSYEKPKFSNMATKPGSNELQRGKISRYVHPASRYVMEKRKEVENKTEDDTDNYQTTKKYVNVPLKTQSPSYKIDRIQHAEIKPNQVHKQIQIMPQQAHTNHLRTPTTKHYNTNSNTRQVKKIRLIRIKTTTSRVWLAKNLATNDSYEDYVPPKKDTDYLEPEINEADEKKDDNENIEKDNSKTKPTVKLNKNVLNIFSDENENTPKQKDFINYEDETTNYNKKKKKITNQNIENNNENIKEHQYNVKVPENLPYQMTGYAEQEIQPYKNEKERGNLQKKEYEIEKEEFVTKRDLIKLKNKQLKGAIRRITPEYVQKAGRSRFSISERKNQDGGQSKLDRFVYRFRGEASSNDADVKNRSAEIKNGDIITNAKVEETTARVRPRMVLLK